MRKTFNIILRAVDNGCDIDPELTITDARDEAENYIREYVTAYDRLERVELTNVGGTQNYTWEGNTVSGDIFDFSGHYKAEDGTLIRVADAEPVNWFDIPSEGPERKDYGFIYAKEFDEDGELVALYDTFKER